MKLSKYITVLMLLLICGSCSDEFLDIEPTDRLTSDSFFKSESEIRAATATLYSFPWFDFNDKFAWTAGDCMSGDLYHVFDQEGQFFFMSFNAGNAPISSGWKGLFRVVSYANSVINDMPAAADGNVSQEVIDAALGEARFIRGFAYYFMSQYWGEIPIVENSTELVTGNNLILPKNTLSSVYEFIRRDFAFAAENLKASDAPGRVTKWGALGMLAKLHLTIASDLNGAESAAHFSDAKNFAGQVIEDSGLSLLPEYESLFDHNNNNHEESLFALQWMEGAYSIGNSRQANFARSSLITGNTEAWGGGKCMTYNFVRSVEGGDLRQPSIFMTHGDHYPNIRKSEGGYTYKIVNRDPSDPNTVLEFATKGLNSLKKYVIGSNEDTGGAVTTGQATRINNIYFRLADVYMIYAEATLAAQSSTSDAKALEYYNAIRLRAGLPNKPSISYEDIIKERRIEFALEGINWFDIKRYYYRDQAAALAYLTDMGRETVYDRDGGPNAGDENTAAGYMLNVPDSPIEFKSTSMWLPIPSAEVVANPLLGPDMPAEEYQF